MTQVRVKTEEVKAEAPLRAVMVANTRQAAQLAEPAGAAAAKLRLPNFNGRTNRRRWSEGLGSTSCENQFGERL